MRFILGAWKVHGLPWKVQGAWEVRNEVRGCKVCGKVQGAWKVRGRCNAYDLIGCGGDP